MKITRIDVYQLSYGLHDQTYAWSGGHSVSRFLTTLVKVSTDEGLSGFGEVCPLGASYMEAHSHGVPSGVREIAPSLIGQDPTKLRAINAAMDTALAGHLYVKSPIDVACWDILGQSLGAPIATLLGGAWVDAYPLYRAISQADPQKMADDVQRYRAEGYRRFQLKVGGDPDVDIQRVLACRRVLESGDVLVADANTGWLPHQALRVVQGIAGVDCYVEQPCATLAECLVVRDRTPQPMVLDELMTGPIPLIQAYTARAMDVINIKISRVGGLTRAKQMRDLCETLGIAMTIEDSWGGDVATAAIAHLAGSTRPEFLFTSTDFNSYIDVSVAGDAPRRAEGRLAVPTAPGLGLHVDESRLPAPLLSTP